MKLIKILFLIFVFYNNNSLYAQSQNCECVIYCQIDSILKSSDSLYNNNQNAVIYFVVSFDEDSSGVVDRIFKMEGIEISLNEFKNICKNIDFSCGNIFLGIDRVKFYFVRSRLIEVCK